MMLKRLPAMIPLMKGSWIYKCTAALQTEERAKNLRLWPGVVAVSVQWLCWVALPLAVPGPVTGIVAVIGGLGGGLAIAV